MPRTARVEVTPRQEAAAFQFPRCGRCRARLGQDQSRIPATLRFNSLGVGDAARGAVAFGILGRATERFNSLGVGDAARPGGLSVLLTNPRLVSIPSVWEMPRAAEAKELKDRPAAEFQFPRCGRCRARPGPAFTMNGGSLSFNSLGVGDAAAARAPGCHEDHGQRFQFPRCGRCRARPEGHCAHIGGNWNVSIPSVWEMPRAAWLILPLRLSMVWFQFPRCGRCRARQWGQPFVLQVAGKVSIPSVWEMPRAAWSPSWYGPG